MGSLLDAAIRGLFFLLIVLVPFFFSVQLTQYSLPKIALVQGLVTLLLAVWALQMVVAGRISFLRSKLSYPFVLSFVLSVASLSYALSWPGGIAFLWQIFAYGIVYFIVVNLLREEEIEAWTLVITLVGMVVSGYGILQCIGVEPLLRGYDYVPYTPTSTLGHRNVVAQYLILLVPLSGTFFFISPSRMRKLLFGVATVQMSCLLLLTKSRGGISGFIVSFLFLIGAIIFRGVERHPFLQRKRWAVLSLLLVPPAALFLFFIASPASLTISVAHINPVGYSIHTVDGSRLSPHEPLRVAFDFKILKGNSGTPGYVNLYGERTNSSPIYLIPQHEGWNHVAREETLSTSAPGGGAIHLRWMPGSEDSVLKLRNISIQSKGGVNLISDTFSQRLFWKLGVTEVDKALSSQARLHLYQNTLAMIRENLFLGVGFGNFKYVYPRYRDRAEWALSGLNTRVEEAHNEYLQILSEVGLLGFLVFVWMVLIIARMSWWMIRNEGPNRRFLVSLGCTMGILATLVQSLFDFNLQNPASAITFWMVVGFLETIYHSARREKESLSPASLVLPLRSCVLRCIIGFGIFAGLGAGLFYSVRPVLGDYYLKEGRLSLEAGDWGTALASFEKASRFTPYHYDVLFHLGQTRMQLRDYEGAIRAYQACLAQHPYFIEARNNLGTVYIKLGRTDEAIEAFKRSIEINPYHPGLHNNLGYVYGKRDLLDKAIEEYEKALELDPQNMEVHKNLGLLYFYKLRDHRKAQEYLEKYLTLNPGDPQADLIRKEIERMKQGGSPQETERN